MHTRNTLGNQMGNTMSVKLGLGWTGTTRSTRRTSIWKSGWASVINLNGLRPCGSCVCDSPTCNVLCFLSTTRISSLEPNAHGNWLSKSMCLRRRKANRYIDIHVSSKAQWQTETWKRIRDTLMAELQTCVLKWKQNVLTQLYIREHYVCLNLDGCQRLAHLTFCWGQPVLDWLQQTTHVRPRMHGRKRYSTNILNTKSTKGLAPRRPRWKWITGTSAQFGVEMPHRRYGNF